MSGYAVVFSNVGRYDYINLYPCSHNPVFNKQCSVTTSACV